MNPLGGMPLDYGMGIIYKPMNHKELILLALLSPRAFHNDEAFRKIRKEWRKELIRLIFNEKEL